MFNRIDNKEVTPDTDKISVDSFVAINHWWFQRINFFYIGKPVCALHMWYHIEGDIGDERNLPEARCRDIKVGSH